MHGDNLKNIKIKIWYTYVYPKGIQQKFDNLDMVVVFLIESIVDKKAP